MLHPPTVRAACARLAALRRWRPDDTAALRQAERDLEVARAGDLLDRAARLLQGGDPE